LEGAAFLERVDDGGVGLEALHALEAGDDLDVNGEIVGALHPLEEVLVLPEVGIAEVELDLLADLGRIAGLLVLVVA
jgi:hypothetical protein